MQSMFSIEIFDSGFQRVFRLLSALWTISKGPWNKRKARNPVPKQRSLLFLWKIC